MTDSAANCKASWTIISSTYPHVTCGPCSAHCLDLLLEDFGKEDWIKKHFAEGKEIVKFVTSHHQSLALFREKSSLELLKPGETRFATNFIMLKRLNECKDALQETVVNPKYKTWMAKKSYRDTGSLISARILDENWWKVAETCLECCEPVVELLRLVDGEQPAVGKVYFKMFKVWEMVNSLESIDADQKVGIKRYFDQRWAMLHTDLHGAGFVLDPEYNDGRYSQASNEEAMTGFLNMCEKLLDPEDQVKAGNELAAFRAGEGIFGRPMVRESAKQLPGYKWWLQYGIGVPALQKVAVKVLAQITSSSASERNWSTFEWIHSKKRNRLAVATAEKLVFIHCNLRLLNKIRDVEYKEETIQWDFDSDSE